MLTRIETLQKRIEAIRADAQARIDDIAQRANERIVDLTKKIGWLEDNGENMKASKFAALQAEVDAMAEEDAMAFAQAKLDERIAMAARGEGIYVPKDVNEMRVILDAMEADD